MKTRVIALCIASACALLVMACSSEEAPKTPAASTTSAAAPAATSGIVEEVATGDGYTYALLNSMGGKFWVAAPPVAVNVGEAVTLKNPTLKSGYKSASLNRTFDPIYFVAEMKPTMPGGMGAASGANPHAGMNMGAMGGATGANPHAGMNMGAMGGGMGGGMGGMPPAQPAAKVDLSGIQKASGGYTVAEIFGKKGQLSGKEVVVRAKVVKMTPGVMGTNWAHIRDGSGSEGSNDITVTTNDSAQAGDLVMVRGLLNTDVDIGSGYFFPILIKDAKISVEKK